MHHVCANCASSRYQRLVFILNSVVFYAASEQKQKDRSGKGLLKCLKRKLQHHMLQRHLESSESAGAVRGRRLNTPVISSPSSSEAAEEAAREISFWALAAPTAGVLNTPPAQGLGQDSLEERSIQTNIRQQNVRKPVTSEADASRMLMHTALFVLG